MSHVTRTFIGLPSPTGIGRDGAGGHPCQGVYYQPTGPTPRVAAIASHYCIDYTEHYLGELLAARGIGFLGWNTQYRGREPYFLLDRAVADIGAGVGWLREKGVDTIVAIGNSGGASLMSAYQSHAKAASLRPSIGSKNLARGLDNLLPADLYISLAAHSGRPEVLTAWMDPSVTDETDPFSTDPSFDMYADHPLPYSAAFLTRYRDAQRTRNERITAWAVEEIERLHTLSAYERLFTIPRTWADPRFVDPSIEPSTRPTPACYAGDPRTANRGVHGIGTVSTLRTWLSMWSLQHSQCLAAPHLTHINEPSLVIHATGDTGAHYSDAQSIHDHLAAADKQLIYIDSDHYFRNQPDDRQHVGDLIADWIQQRT
jgi:hypothetical protein